MRQRHTIATYLIARLRELGAKHVFAVPGDYTAAFLDALDRDGDITRVATSAELEAGYAADAYARQAGVGVACVAAGVGAYNLLGPLAGAHVESVPVVLITAGPSREAQLRYRYSGLYGHHMLDHALVDLQVMRNVTVAAARITDAASAPGQIDSTLLQCKRNRGPVFLEVARDLFDIPCPPPSVPLLPLEPIRTDGATHGSDNGGSDSDGSGEQTPLAQLVESVHEALTGHPLDGPPPIIWAGEELQRLGLEDELRTLLVSCDADYVTGIGSKGLISEADSDTGERFVGVFYGSLPSRSEVWTAIQEAPFVLILGVYITDMGLSSDPVAASGVPALFPRTALVCRDTAVLDDELHAPVDLAEFMAAVNLALANRPAPVRSNRAARSPAASPAEASGGDMTFDRFFAAMRDFVTAEHVLLADTGFSFYEAIELPCLTHHGFVSQPSWNAIGYAMGATLGTAFARPDKRPLTFVGDGAFQVTAQALSAMVATGCRPVVFVFRNATYGLEQFLIRADPFQDDSDAEFDEYDVIPSWDYVKLAEAMGAIGLAVTDDDSLDAALAQVRANDGAALLVQVDIDPLDVPTNLRALLPYL